MNHGNNNNNKKKQYIGMPGKIGILCVTMHKEILPRHGKIGFILHESRTGCGSIIPTREQYK